MSEWRERDFFIKQEYLKEERERAICFRVPSRDTLFSPYIFWFPKSLIKEIRGGSGFCGVYSF